MFHQYSNHIQSENRKTENRKNQRYSGLYIYHCFFSPHFFFSFLNAYHYAEGLLDGYPPLRLPVVVGVLESWQVRPGIRDQHAVGSEVRRVAQDEVVRGQFLEEVVEPGKLEGRAVLLAPGTVHGPCDDPVVRVKDSLYTWRDQEFANSSGLGMPR